MKKELSIIIVNYNTKTLLKNCLNSIVENTKGVDYEIIVVDNASLDGSVDMIKSNFPQVIIIENNDNYGFAKANNKGVESANGQYILLLNSDTVLKNGDFLKLFQMFEADKSIGAIGCKVLNYDQTLQYSCFRFPTFIYEYFRFTFWLIKFFPNHLYAHSRLIEWDHNEITAVDCIAGCFLLTRKIIVNTLGLFDDNFFMSYEDADFCFKLRKNGFKVIYYPSYSIIHYSGSSTKQVVAALSNKRSFRSMVYYFKKNRNSIGAFFLKHAIYLTWIFFVGSFLFLKLFSRSPVIIRKKEMFKDLLFS